MRPFTILSNKALPTLTVNWLDVGVASSVEVDMARSVILGAAVSTQGRIPEMQHVREFRPSITLRAICQQYPAGLAKKGGLNKAR